MIRLLGHWHGHHPGTVVDVADNVAYDLVNAGLGAPVGVGEPITGVVVENFKAGRERTER